MAIFMVSESLISHPESFEFWEVKGRWEERRFRVWNP